MVFGGKIKPIRSSHRARHAKYMAINYDTKRSLRHILGCADVFPRLFHERHRDIDRSGAFKKLLVRDTAPQLDPNLV
jgi:hypothetical protein